MILRFGILVIFIVSLMYTGTLFRDVVTHRQQMITDEASTVQARTTQRHVPKNQRFDFGHSQIRMDQMVFHSFVMLIVFLG